MKIQNKASLYLLALTSLLFAFSGCGPSSSLNTTSPEGSEFLRLRWFPIAQAENYVLQVETVSGELVVSEEIEPQGCTHQPKEGYTSGICFYDFKPQATEEELSIQLGARTRGGLTEAALLRYRK